MKTFIGGHQAIGTDEFIELALGTPLELWLGESGESEEERVARLDAARDILAENPDLPDEITRIIADLIEAQSAPLNVTTLHRVITGGRNSQRGAVAA
ncbi:MULTISPECIES: hypothetical protein [Streptomyces]|uniref:Uncharacterized protein n=1 Tax=Streptomyces griseocarneus TaxID=51201 RepID=A0ABX7RPI2_9ACTN|nr:MULTISPECIES: hypothetical protein [Streptomyces]QSY50195.1 hypothetical protein J3S04_03845 [Streptomyces griseocarneus]